MPIPESTRRSLAQRLEQRRAERWPGLSELTVSFRSNFAYIASIDDQGQPNPLFRLRYYGSASSWGFAIYLWSREGYDDSILPSGSFSGSPEEALDCACGLYLNDPTAWIDDSPTNL
jgi:hypothetical protein